MDRLTVKSATCQGRYNLRCMCGMGGGTGLDVELLRLCTCADYCDKSDNCARCGIQQAFNRLAAYEDTGLTPEQINDLIKEEALWKIKSFT